MHARSAVAALIAVVLTPAPLPSLDRQTGVPPPLQAAPELEVQTGHTAGVLTLALSEDGRVLASGGLDGRVVLWDVMSRKQLHALRAPGGIVMKVTLSSDGRFVGASSGVPTPGSTGHVTIWRTDTGIVTTTRQMQKGHFAHDLAFLAGGSRYAVISDVPGTSNVKSAAVEIRTVDGARVRSMPLPAVSARSLSFNHDETLMAVGGAGGARAKAVSDGRWSSLARGSLVARGAVAFRPERDELAVVTTAGQYIIDVRTRVRRPLAAPRATAQAPGASRIITLSWSPDGRLLAGGTDDRRVVVWDGDTGRVLNVWRVPTVRTGRAASGIVTALALSSDGLAVAATDIGPLWAWDARAAVQVTGFERTVEAVASIAFTSETSLVAVLEDSVRKWHLDRPGGEGFRLAAVPGTDRAWGRHVAIDRRGRLMAISRSQVGTDVVDATSGELRARVPSRNPWSVVRVAMSPDGAQLAGAVRYSGDVEIVSPGSGKHLFWLHGHTSVVNAIAYTPNGRVIVTGSGEVPGMGTEDNSVRLWSARDGRPLRALRGHKGAIVGVAVASDGSRLASASDDGTVRIWRMPDGRFIRAINAHDRGVTSVAVSPDGSRIATGGLRGEMAIWNAVDGQLVVAIAEHTGVVQDIAYSPSGRLIASTSVDGTVRIRDAASGTLKAIVVASRQGHVIVTPHGDFAASEGGIDGVAYRIGRRGYSFEQFDLRHNRPDKVFAALGLADPDTLRVLQDAYVRRMKRAGRSHTDTEAPWADAPVVRLSEPPPIATAQRTIRLAIHASDPTSPIARLHMTVNGVPLHGAEGLKVGRDGSRDITQTIPVDLSTGANIVQVSAINEAGIEGAAERVIVHYTGGARPRVHVVSIGVSRYADATMNLRYAAKDAADVAELFDARRESSGATRHLLLVNADATRDSVLQRTRTFLQEAQVDDLVILFLAGHGMLDRDFVYYFAPHDMVFERPADRGLTIEDIEGLAASTAARRRLVLIDSCHVGEIDVGADAIASTAAVVARPVAAARGLAASDRRSLAALDIAFADVRRGSGTIIVGAAGGLEFAFEGQGTANGLFTYAVLSALRGGPADRDGDGSIRVSELRHHVAEQVVRLTRGLQRPLVRRDNHVSDFTVFNVR